jgi:hypothetical protein
LMEGAEAVLCSTSPAPDPSPESCRDLDARHDPRNLQCGVGAVVKSFVIWAERVWRELNHLHDDQACKRIDPEISPANATPKIAADRSRYLTRFRVSSDCESN